MAMTIEQVRDDFGKRLQARPAGDRYLDRPWEREALRFALGNGVTVDIARQALIEMCQDRGFLLESTVLRDARHRLSVRAAANQKIDEREFGEVTAAIREKLGDRLEETTIHRMLCEIIDDNQYPVHKGLFGENRWYEKVRNSAGLE
ncbi:MAG: hypothetical protein LW700_06140 [Gemmataceae bacterium]|jgi:hypothetical protein|nr:hypothetical protein [Gemmataceae bacterium]